MNRDDWDAMGREEKHALMAGRVMQWKGPGTPEQLAEIEHLNKNTFSKHPLGEDECQGWVLGKGHYVYDLGDYRFTTDRNACALVLDEIERRGHDALVEFDLELTDALCDARPIGVTQQMAERERYWEWLRADPDLICYCAVKAVENAR